MRRVVDIREGELRPTLHLAGLLALLIAGHTVGETARDALFLSRLPPERLTLVYVLLAALSLAVGAATAALATRFGRRAALVVTLAVCAAGAVALFLAPLGPVTVFVLYLASGIAGTVLTLQFWMLAGPLFTVAQGKRLLGPVAAGGVLGAACGGGASALALRAVPTSALLLLAAGLFVGAAALAARVPVPPAAERAPQATRRTWWRGDLAALRKDRFVLLVAAMTTLGTATALVADYLFKSTAARSFQPQELGSFFATFYAVQNSVALLVQVVVTGLLVRRIGVTGGLAVLPLLMCTGGLSGVVSGGAVAAFAAKGADGSMRHSLHRVASELVLLPMRAELRDRVKPLLDTLFGRGAQALTAGAVLALASFGLDDPRTLSWVMLGLGLAWLATVAAIRTPYVDLFRRAIARGELPGGAADDLDVAAIEAVMEALASSDEQTVVAAIDVLHESGRSRVLPAIILYHASPRVLERALVVLASAERRDWVPLAKKLVDHGEAGVRACALRALAAIGDEPAVQRGLSDGDDRVRACAAFFLAQRRAAEAPQQAPEIALILARDGEEGARARAALLGIIAELGDAAWLPVVEAVVAREGGAAGVPALVAAAVLRTGDERFLPYLIGQLGANDGRGVIRDAVAAMGEPAFAALTAALEDGGTAPRVRLEIPRRSPSCAPRRPSTGSPRGWGGGQRGAALQAAARLERLRQLGSDTSGARLRFDRRMFEGEARKNLVEHFRMVALTDALCRSGDDARAEGTAVGRVLLGLLGDKRNQSLDRAFRALQLGHPDEDLGSVQAAVTRGDKRARANALELLEALPVSAAETKELVRLTAEELPPAQSVARARRALGSSPDAARIETHAGHHPAVLRLLEDRDDVVAALAAYHALDSGAAALVREAQGTLDARPSLGNLGARQPLAREGRVNAR
ncbi:MAG: hypothetical protein WKG00_09235 [Polyangiaceae bacterium]